MNRNIERDLPLPLLLWRVCTQPFWTCLERFVDLFIRIKLRQLDVRKDEQSNEKARPHNN